MSEGRCVSSISFEPRYGRTFLMVRFGAFAFVNPGQSFVLWRIGRKVKFSASAIKGGINDPFSRAMILRTAERIFHKVVDGKEPR